MSNEDVEHLMLVHIWSTKPARECVSTLKINALKVIGETFSKNMEDVDHMMALPELVAMRGHLSVREMVLYTQALAETRGYMDSKSEATKQKVRDKVVELRKKENAEERVDAMVKEGQRVLRELLSNHENVRSSMRSLLGLSLSAFWTAFECLAKDAWIFVVNSRPNDVVSRVLHAVASEGESDGLSEKQISIRLLARYGFDLRGALGYVLVEKFDFTSVTGIRKAYAALFGKLPELEEIFTDESINHLEAIRHVIVHRAGIVDDEYIKRVRSPLSKGEMVPINAETTERFGNVVVDSGCALLRFVDGRCE